MQGATSSAGSSIETLCHALDARAIQLQALANDFEVGGRLRGPPLPRGELSQGIVSCRASDFECTDCFLDFRRTSLVDENGRLWSNIANRAKLQHKPTRKDAIACIVFVRPNHILMSSTSTLLWRLETLDGFDRVLW